MTSGVDIRTDMPYVTYRWGDNEITFTIAKAREHAYKLLAIAESAEKDILVVKWAKFDLKLSPGKIKIMLQRFRNFRVRQRIDEIPDESDT